MEEQPSQELSKHKIALLRHQVGIKSEVTQD